MKTIKIKKTNYRGTVIAPPSKSDAHRLLICAGLAEGKSVIHGISESEDMKATLDCLASLGAKITRDGDTVTVIGTDPRKRKEAVLHCRESGSTMRFFIPLCLLSDEKASLFGSETLLSRPLDVYEEICLGQGLELNREDGKIVVCGPLTSGYFKVDGGISSQFISGLIFALPLLDGFSVIELIPPIASRSYIDMTLDAVSKFGIKAEFSEDGRIIIQGNQKYIPTEASAEGDWSNAAFFLAMEMLGHDVYVEGLKRNTLQGDSVVRILLPRMARSRPTIDIENCPDTAPVLMAAAAALNGAEFINTDRLRIKESDRGSAMAEELAKFGINVTLGDNRIAVHAPEKLITPTVPINGHNDHRIVMACAVLLTLTGGEIEGYEAVNKSYPDFFDDLFSLISE